MVVINKLDRLGYSRDRFHEVESLITAFLHSVNIVPCYTIPISARDGENIVRRSAQTGWYEGPTVLEALDSFQPTRDAANLPLRFPVQDVYRWDDRRLYAGRVETGRLRVGDRVVFSPSGHGSRVKSIEKWRQPDLAEAAAGECVAITLHDEIFVEPGQVLSLRGQEPSVGAEIGASVFWLGRAPLTVGGTYIIRLAAAESEARLLRIDERIDSSTLEVLERHAAALHSTEVGRVVFELRKPFAADAYDANPRLGRFVVVDGETVAGGGVIRSVSAAEAGRAPRVLALDERLCTEPNGYFVDLSAERGPIEVDASPAFLDGLSRGNRVAFRLPGPDLAQPLARLAYEHGLVLELRRQGEAAWALLYRDTARSAAAGPVPSPAI